MSKVMIYIISFNGWPNGKTVNTKSQYFNVKAVKLFS